MLKKLMIAVTAMTVSTAALAAQEPRVLYMGVDQGKEMMSRNSQVHRRIFEHTGNYLQHENIRVFEARKFADESNSFKDAMRNIKKVKSKQFDAVVMVAVKHKTDRSGKRLNDRVVAIARIVDPHSLEIIDTIRVKSPLATLNVRRCERSCRNKVMRRHVREILPEFKDRLVDRLYDLPVKVAKKKVKKVKSGQKLTLTLKGFKPREVRFLEDRIAVLDSTRDFSWLTSQDSKPAFWLERRKNAQDVRDELSDVLASLDLQARIIQTPRQITLIKMQREVAWLD